MREVIVKFKEKKMKWPLILDQSSQHQRKQSDKSSPTAGGETSEQLI